MARPNKNDLPYFPHDVNSSGDKIQYVESKFGLDAYGIYFKLLEKIYSFGYYMIFNERDIVLFSSQINIKLNLLKEILECFFEENIFNKKLYKKYKILTSSGIQKRYITACARRKEVKLIKEYLLVNLNEKVFEKINSKDIVYIKLLKEKEYIHKHFDTKISKVSKENSIYKSAKEVLNK